MPLDLDYGYQSPSAGDESSTEFMPIIEEFIDRIVHHTHDGNDSPLIDDIDPVKTTVDISAARIVTTGTYSSGTKNAVLGVTGVVANMYGYNADLAYEAYVLSATGLNVVMSSNFTASATGSAITFSNYKRVSDSLYEQTVALPTGDVGINNIYKFYVTTTGDYYLRNIYPTIKDTISNSMTIQLNDDSLDLKLVLS